MANPRGTNGTATFEAHPNIALVKYWGMRDEGLGLPFNSSLSLTLDEIVTRTTVRFDPGLDEDRFLLNGVAQAGGPLASTRTFLDHVRTLASIRAPAEVRSVNNFPTATGLASSASGFAALAGAASSAAGLRLTPRKLSQLARLGSGSASRSVFGGFVEWKAGVRSDGVDCYARPLFPPTYWPEFLDLVVIVRGAPEKQVRSAQAMQSTVATSPLYRDRLKNLPRRLARIRRALRERDAGRLFPFVMEECDDFRSVCETTRPSLDYLTATSRAVLGAVREANDSEGGPVAAYTHDAGAHVHVFVLRPHLRALHRRLTNIPGVLKVQPLRPGPGVRATARAVP
jgi:diphosphomevalonate decarboxylase